MRVMRRLKRNVAVVTTALALGAGLAMGLSGVATAAPGHDNPSNSVAKPRSPIVWSHRGASKEAPEETPASYQKALEEGADVLEGDLAETKDGQLVMNHDATLTRTTNVKQVFPDRAPWNVRDFTLAELKQLDAGSWWAPEFAGQKIMTFHEWIAFNSGRAGLAPEIKSPNLYPGMVDKLVAELKSWGYTRDMKAANGAPQIWVQSFDPAALQDFHSKLPEVPTLALVSNYTYLTASDAELKDMAGWATAIAGNQALSNASEIARVHSFGIKVVSEVEDGPSLIDMAVKQGYDVVFTDTPRVANAVLGGRNPFPGNKGVVIDSVVYNPEGNDVQPDGGEYIVLRNTTARPIDISGDTLREFGNALLHVGTGAVIEPGSLYKVYVGPGTDRADAHFNGLTSQVFADTLTDHVYLYDKTGVMQDIYSYIAS